MVYPQPKYKASIIHSELFDINNEEKAKRAYEALKRYLREHTLMIHKHGYDRTNNYSFEQFSCMNADSVVIQSGAETKKGNFHTERIPIGWSIELFSFSTPVDKVRRDLERIIKYATK